MKKQCENCKYSKHQFKNMVKNKDGSYKYNFDKSWLFSFDDLNLCTNLISDFRSKEIENDNCCDMWECKNELR